MLNQMLVLPVPVSLLVCLRGSRLEPSTELSFLQRCIGSFYVCASGHMGTDYNFATVVCCRGAMSEACQAIRLPLGSTASTNWDVGSYGRLGALSGRRLEPAARARRAAAAEAASAARGSPG